MSSEALPGPVADYLADNRAERVDFLETLVGFDTRNPPGCTVDAVAWLESALDDHGVATDRVTVDPEKPNLLATVEGATDRTVCFNGHLDTVPFDPGEWSYDPLGERVEVSGDAGNGATEDDEGTHIYGRGTTDMKGAVAAMLQVAVAHAHTGTEPPVDFRFAFVSDEEVGGDAGLSTVLDTPGFDPDACVVGETTSRKGRYSVSVADRGNVWLTLEATGTAAHGSRPMIGDNAVDTLYRAIERLRSEFGQRELPIDDAVDGIIEESVGFYEPEAGAAATRDLYRYPTINLGRIEGGTAINTVPASACARVDVRVTAGVATTDVLRGIRECLDGVANVGLTDVSWTQGSYDPLDSPLVDAAATAAESVVDDRVYRRSATGGGDAKALRHAGIPAVEFGFGTQTAHGTDEYTTVTALDRNATAYALLPYVYDRRADGV